MTWYWWTHWFWITALIGTLTGSPAVAFPNFDNPATKTFPIADRQSSSAKHGEPLHFPIAVHESDEDQDEDDVFNGHFDGSQFHGEWETPSPRIPLIRPITAPTTRLVIATQRPLSTTPNYSPEHIITAKLNTRPSDFASSSAAPQTTNSSEILSSANGNNISYNNSNSNNASADILRNYTNVTSESITSHEVDDRPNHTSNDPTLSKPSSKPVRQSKNLANQRLTATDVNSVDNFTAETKNLLTAISAAAVSASDDDVISERKLNADARTASVLDAGAISGICVAALGLCAGVATAGVLAYRRRYVNKPQTLNEPDSSGYIDDSTIRDNSDEMYSLDNDSFLNSLEAMTIQNYWTENVKHTKL